MSEAVQIDDVERVSGFRLEDFPKQFSELELLGLDEPKFSLIRNAADGEHHLMVSKLVYFLFTVEGAVEEVRKHFKLDIQKDNMGRVPQNKTDGYKLILLRLLGVKYDDVVELGYHRTGNLSDGFKKKKSEQDSLRNTYPFRHPEEFPKIHQLLKQIKDLTGLDKEELFQEGKIPSPFLWSARGSSVSAASLKEGRKIILLEDILGIAIDALSGEMTFTELAQKHKYYKRDKLRNYVLNGPLSEALVEKIREKIVPDTGGARL